MMLASPRKNQLEFIKELKIKKPEIILYKSEKYDAGYSKALTLVDEYIQENYVFHSKFDYWTFYKIN